MSFQKIKKHTEKEQDKEYQEMLDNVVPLVRILTKLFAENIDAVPIGQGDVLDERYIELTKKCVDEIEKYSREHGFKLERRQYLFQLMKETLNIVEQHTMNTIGKQIRDSFTLVVGKPVDELHFHEFDDILKRVGEIRDEYQKTKVAQKKEDSV